MNSVIRFLQFAVACFVLLAPNEGAHATTIVISTLTGYSTGTFNWFVPDGVHADPITGRTYPLFNAASARVFVYGAGGNGGDGCNSNGTAGSAMGGAGGGSGGLAIKYSLLVSGGASAGTPRLTPGSSVSVSLGTTSGGTGSSNDTLIKDGSGTVIAEASAGGVGAKGVISSTNAQSQDFGCVVGTPPQSGGARGTGVTGDLLVNGLAAGNNTNAGANATAGAGAPTPYNVFNYTMPNANGGGAGLEWLQGGGVGAPNTLAPFGGGNCSTSRYHSGGAKGYTVPAYASCAGQTTPGPSGGNDGGGGLGGLEIDGTSGKCKANSGGNGGTFKVYEDSVLATFFGPSGGGGSGAGHDTSCTNNGGADTCASTNGQGGAGCGGNGTDGVSGCGGGGGGGDASKFNTGAGGVGGPACIVIQYIPNTSTDHFFAVWQPGLSGATAYIPSDYSSLKYVDCFGNGGDSDNSATLANSGAPSGGFARGTTITNSLSAGLAITVSTGKHGSGASSTELDDSGGAAVCKATGATNPVADGNTTPGNVGTGATGSTLLNGTLPGKPVHCISSCTNRPGTGGAGGPGYYTSSVGQGSTSGTSPNTNVGAASGGGGAHDGTASSNASGTSNGTNGGNGCSSWTLPATCNAQSGAGLASSAGAMGADGTYGSGAAGAGGAGNKPQNWAPGWGANDSYYSDGIGPGGGGGGGTASFSVVTTASMGGYGGIGAGGGGPANINGTIVPFKGFGGDGLIIMDYTPTSSKTRAAIPNRGKSQVTPNSRAPH